jgi:hypothetical protein
LSHPYAILQFGKTSSSKFAIDFRYPLSPLQAFGIALTAFAVDNKSGVSSSSSTSGKQSRRAEYEGSGVAASSASGKGKAQPPTGSSSRSALSGRTSPSAQSSLPGFPNNGGVGVGGSGLGIDVDNARGFSGQMDDLISPFSQGSYGLNR